MPKEILEKWPEIAIIIFLSLQLAKFILNRINGKAIIQPCKEFADFKLEAKSKMATNRKTIDELQMQLIRFEGKLDVANNEICHIKETQQEMKQDINDVKNDITYIVGELRNGTKFARTK